jgi:serine protease AprX
MRIGRTVLTSILLPTVVAAFVLADSSGAGNPDRVTTSKTWVYLTDRGGRSPGELARAIQRAPLSERALERRRARGASEITDVHDLPVYAGYLERLRETGCVLKRTSKYLNAVSVLATPAQLAAIDRLPFVDKTAPVRTYHRAPRDRREPAPNAVVSPGVERSSSALDYGPSFDQLDQINVIPLHEAGLHGEGVMIAVFDTGFNRRHEAFQSLQVEAEWDFIFDDGNTENEPGDSPSQHNHGSQVLSVVAGYAPGHLIGPAYAATVVLAKTERVYEEVEGEEDDFVRALEWADSIGVDIVSSSLGYFNWYTFADMDGNTAVTTIACDIAASKGITVCTAAGNEQSSWWGHIIAPSDGDSVIAVGAVNGDGAVTSFSSPGPTYDGRIKPDVCARGYYVTTAVPSDSLAYTSYANGTSFSTPLVAGSCALLLQQHPDWGPMDILTALRNEASNAAAPNNDIGWGIINAYQSALAGATAVMESVSLELRLSGDVVRGTIFNGASSARTLDVVRYKVEPNAGGREETKAVASDILVPGVSSGTFTDVLQTGGVYWYRVQLSGDPSQVSGWASIKFAYAVWLGQSAPNPFVAGSDADVAIPYSMGGVPSDPNTSPPIGSYSDVLLEVFDVSGARVATLVDRIESPGAYAARWDGRDDGGNPVASGVYFYRLQAADRVLTRKLVLIRR